MPLLLSIIGTTVGIGLDVILDLSALWRPQIMWYGLQMKASSIGIRHAAVDLSLLGSFAKVASPMLSTFSIAKFLPIGPDPGGFGAFTHAFSVCNERKSGGDI